MFTCICTDLTGFLSINRDIEINMTCVLLMDSLKKNKKQNKTKQKINKVFSGLRNSNSQHKNV